MYDIIPTYSPTPMEPMKPHQIEGVSFLVKNRFCLLADDMGMGKTRQVIVAADTLSIDKILVICPAGARSNWEREFNKWSILGRDFAVCDTVDTELKDCSIVSFAYATTKTEELRKRDWDLVIVDEAHFVKEHTSDRTLAVYGKNGVIRKTYRFWALSGTPAPNNNSELWVILYTLGATPLKYGKFIEKYCVLKFEGKNRRGNPKAKPVGNKAEYDDEIKEMLSKIMLRRTKDANLTELPSIVFEDVFVEAGNVDLETTETFFEYVFPTDRRKELAEIVAEGERLITDTLNAVRKYGANGIKIIEGLAGSTAVATLVKYNGLQKIEPTVKLLKYELDKCVYDKIVIFAISRDVINLLRIELKDYDVVTIYGGTPPKKRDANVKRFQTNPKCRVFIGNITAAGTAITLTSASEVLFIQQEWTPGNNAQAAMRVHRIGQTCPVRVRCISIRNTIDEAVTRIIRRKTRELTAIFDPINEEEL